MERTDAYLVSTGITHLLVDPLLLSRLESNLTSGRSQSERGSNHVSTTSWCIRPEQRARGGVDEWTLVHSPPAHDTPADYSWVVRFENNRREPRNATR